MMKDLLRTVMTLVLLLMISALPVPLHADGNQILTHGLGNTNRSSPNPKDLTVAPVLKDKRVKPAVPAAVNKGMVPVVAVQVAATMTAHETNGTWRWNTMLQNTDTKSLPANRLKLKVVQVLSLPNQTAPAGIEFVLPPLGPQQKRGFSSTWNRNRNARQLRLEIWDQRANTRVYEQALALATTADQFAAPISPGARKALARPEAREPARIAITDGRYLGRGAWELELGNRGIGTVPAGAYEYTWIYKFSTGTDRFYTDPKDIAFPVPGNQPRTLLEVGEFYAANDCDCAALNKIEVTVREKESGQEEVFDINVAIPNVEIKDLHIQPGETSAPNFFNQAKIRTTVINHSYYNLMLAYTLEVRMVKRDSQQGVISENFTRTGTIMLPARQTNENAILVNDLREDLPHLEIDDSIAYHRDRGFSDDDLQPGIPSFYGALTISMPANAKCGPGRPLDFLQGALWFWSFW